MTISFPRTRRVRAFPGAMLLMLFASLAHAQSNTLPRVPLEPNEPQDVRNSMALGLATAVFGGRAYVGAPGTDGHGAVYVFTQQGGNWVQTHKLVAPDLAPGKFGERIVADGDSVLISDTQRGRVYYFVREGSVYKPKAVLKGGVEQFGTRIALEGCTAFISSGTSFQPVGPGWVHVFNRCPSGTWIYKGSFQAPDRQAGDFFGFSLSFTGTELLVGAPFRDSRAGAAYRYVYAPGSGSTNWKFAQKITSAHPGAGNAFGYSVSFKNGLAAISSPNRVLGEVELFKRGPTHNNWVSLTTFGVPDDQWDAFGYKLLVTPERVFVATNMNPTSLKIPGSLYVYRRGAGDALTIEAHLVQESSDSDTNFAADYDVSGRALVIGEPGRFTGPFTRGGGADLYVLPN